MHWGSSQSLRRVVPEEDEDKDNDSHIHTVVQSWAGTLCLVRTELALGLFLPFSRAP